MPSMPRHPPVPVVIHPHEEASWPEYHKGARYSASILGIGVLALLSVIVLLVVAITHSMLVTGLIGVGAALVLLWLVPKMHRRLSD